MPQIKIEPSNYLDVNLGLDQDDDELDELENDEEYENEEEEDEFEDDEEEGDEESEEEFKPNTDSLSGFGLIHILKV